MNISKHHGRQHKGVRMSNGSVMRALTNRRTHRQIDGTDFIPSTTDARGNNYITNGGNRIQERKIRFLFP